MVNFFRKDARTQRTAATASSATSSSATAATVGNRATKTVPASTSKIKIKTECRKLPSSIIHLHQSIVLGFRNFK